MNTAGCALISLVSSSFVCCFLDFLKCGLKSPDFEGSFICHFHCCPKLMSYKKAFDENLYFRAAFFDASSLKATCVFAGTKNDK